MGLIGRLTIAVVCLSLVIGVPAGAQNILLLNEPCGGSIEHFPPALTNLGLAFTETNTDADFLNALTTGGPWDLVIVDEYSALLSAGSLTEIQNYIAAGGVAYMNYWSWDAAMAASFEATLGASYTVPLTIFRWDPAAPVFNNPNAVPDLVPDDDTCNADGAMFEPTGGGIAVAGYTAAPTAGEAGIIIGNEGRTLLFGGILGLFGADGQAFAENAVEFLLFGGGPAGPPIVEVPALDGLGLTVLAVLLAGLSLLVLRRRRIS